VCIFGPESTGKSTLAADLAREFRTVHVAEYARGLLDFKGGRCDPEDIPLIVRGQIASEEALARQANRVLFCDTDPLTTSIWSDWLFGDCPNWARQEARRRRYHLTLLMDVDVEWVDDRQRFLRREEQRQAFFDRCREALEAHGRPYVIIRGSWNERFSRARQQCSRCWQAILHVDGHSHTREWPAINAATRPKLLPRERGRPLHTSNFQ